MSLRGSNEAVSRMDTRARLSVGHPTVAKEPYFGQFGDDADAAFLSVWPGGKPDLRSRSVSSKYDRTTRHEGEVDWSGPWLTLLSVGDPAHMIGSCRLAYCHPHPQKSIFSGWRWRYSQSTSIGVPNRHIITTGMSIGDPLSHIGRH